MKRNRQPASLREKVIGSFLLCWILPIAIIVIVAGMLLRTNYERNVHEQLEEEAEHALSQVEMRLEEAFVSSKAVSYDGIVRAAYRDYQQTEDTVSLYRTVNEYLGQNFSRDERFQAVFLSFWEKLEVYPYVMSSGIRGYSLPRNYHRSIEPLILEEMRLADTAIRLLAFDGELYIARNLLDSRFEPYATLVMMCDKEAFFSALDGIRRISGVSLILDDVILDAGGDLRFLREAEEVPAGDLILSGDLEGHSVMLSADTEPYDIFSDIPELRIALIVLVLLVVPLLLVIVMMFRRHVTRPVEALLTATDRLQEGERGYQIQEKADSLEFERIFRHFNAMSAELKNQFERSYLEQQALQNARMKALQLQINPHFLNNTLEIINWEARLAGDDRVSAMIEALSVMLDAALGRDGRSRITLREELTYVDAYLYIIRERLGERLQISREIDESLLEEAVPRLILQPVVENAVEHDLAQNSGGQLSLRAFREGGNIVLETEHDGTMSPEDLESIRQMLSSTVIDTDISGQVGLRNVKQRLSLLYGEKGVLTVEQCKENRILARVSFPAIA